MNCRICGSICEDSFFAKVLNKYNVQYVHCPQCDFLQTEVPYWLEDAYADALNIYDTGVMQRNNMYADLLAPILYYLLSREGKYLDFAGGYGIFVRIMRDMGCDYYWVDPFAKNLLSRGFEQLPGCSYTAITCFEFFEHAINPLLELKQLLASSPVLFFSTLLRPTVIPDTGDWWYYGFEHGQHISLYSLKTLQYMAKIVNKKLVSDGNSFHMFIPEVMDANPFIEYLHSRRIDKKLLLSELQRNNISKIELYKRKVMGQINLQNIGLPSLHSKTVDDHIYLKSLSISKAKLDNKKINNP